MSIWFGFFESTFYRSSFLNIVHTPSPLRIQPYTFKQKPSSSNILFYMPFQELSDSNRAQKKQKNFFVTFFQTRTHHSKLWIVDFTSIFIWNPPRFFLFHSTFYFHFFFCRIPYTVILKSTTNKELLLIHAKSLCANKK